MPDGAPIAMRILRCGAVAVRLLRSHTTAQVAAVFDRSFYIEADGQFVCIGCNKIGDGPLNAIVSETHFEQALACLTLAQTVAMSPSAGRASILLEAKRATTWCPAAWPPIRSPAALTEQITLFRPGLMERAPHDGLARLVMALGVRAEEDASPLHRVALPRVEQLGMWLWEALSTGRSIGPPPVGLLGLGPGLTPSGDDVLGGLMIVLDALAERALRNRIADAVLEAAPAATSPLSAAFLRAAAEGLGSSALHQFVAAVVGGGDEATVLATAESLAEIGYTSGWDAMAGAVLGLEAWAATQSR